MTSPDGALPAGSLAPGLFAERQAMDADEAKAQMTAQPIDSYVNAQDIWKAFCRRERKTAAELKDGQLALRGRTELLSQVSAYGAAVMAYNWNIPYSTWCVLPFDTQLGPVKGVQVSTPASETGYLTLKRGGLWRVDAMTAVQGHSVGAWFTINPLTNLLEVHYSYSPIFPTLMLEVVNARGQLISATQCDMVSDLTVNSQIYLETNNAPRSAAFSKTFVLPDMPPENAPDASDHWVHVRLAIRYEPIHLGMISETSCKVLGGTARSALTATRWSRDATHINYADEVPDGGDLG